MHFLPTFAVLALVARLVETKGNCGVLLTGPACKDSIGDHPSCIDGAFKGSWLTLDQRSVAGNSPDKWVAGEDFPKEIVHSLPPHDVFGGAPSLVPSCALVSSSSALKGRKLGRQIDGHDLIMRINQAPTKGFEQDVGSRTDLRWTAAAFQGFRENPGEAVVAKWCAQGPHCGMGEELRFLNAKKVHALNPAFLEYVNNRVFRTAKVNPTSGFAALLFLMHRCQQVTAYGFQGSRLKDWYYQPAGTKQPPKEKWLREKYWEVDEWTYASASSKQRAQAPKSGASTLGLSHAGVGGGHKSAIRGPRRRLLHEVEIERRCMTDLAKAKLIRLV